MIVDEGKEAGLSSEGSAVLVAAQQIWHVLAEQGEPLNRYGWFQLNKPLTCSVWGRDMALWFG